MQNKCGCHGQSGFIPVDSNWDFNMDGACNDCQAVQRNGRRNAEPVCAAEAACTRKNVSAREAGCPCETPCQREMPCQETVRQSGCVREQENCRCTHHTNNRQVECEATGRSAECLCTECNRNRNGCEQNGGCTTCHNHVGLVSVKMQQIGDVYRYDRALQAGTLFPELYMPLAGYCAGGNGCGTTQQAADFAVWEMRLYLDTHPDDQQALALFAQLCRQTNEPNYAATFLPECCASAWGWVNDPWPWEYEANCH